MCYLTESSCLQPPGCSGQGYGHSVYGRVVWPGSGTAGGLLMTESKPQTDACQN